MKKKICCFILFIIIAGFFLLTCDDEKQEKQDDVSIDQSEETNDTRKEDSETEIASVKPSFDLEEREDQPPLDSKEAFTKWRLERFDETEKMISWRWDRAAAAILRKDITQQRVLAAFLRTPREVFARKHNINRAYEDAALGLAFGQTISGPHMVLRTTNELNPSPGQKVLEIGTGSGYQSAVFAQLSNFVYTIEIVEPLAKETEELQLGMAEDFPEYKNIKHKVADGYYGWPEYAPFDRIAVTCGIDHIPPPLLEQLAPDGIMLIPVGPPDGQTMLKVTKTVNDDGSVTINREDVYKGTYYPIFVPFTNAKGKRHSVGEDKPEL